MPSYSTQDVHPKFNGSTSLLFNTGSTSYPVAVHSLDTVIALLDTSIIASSSTEITSINTKNHTVADKCDKHISPHPGPRTDDNTMLPENNSNLKEHKNGTSSPRATSPVEGDTALMAADPIILMKIKQEKESSEYSSEDISDQSSGSTSPRRARCRSKRKRLVSQKQRQAANLRERKRMLSLNEAFQELHQVVPTFDYERKMPRVDILRLAIVYIHFLMEMMSGKNPESITLSSEHKSIRSKISGRSLRRHKAESRKLNAESIIDSS